VLPEIRPGCGGILHTQGKVARADRVGAVLEQQMKVVIAQVKPQDREIKRPRFIDFLETEDISIKPPAALHVADYDRAMIDLRYLHGNLERNFRQGTRQASSSNCRDQDI